MALTPPSLTRSPSSPPNTYCSSERSSLDYPSPPRLVEQQYKLTSIYGSNPPCSMTPPLDTMSQSEWGTPSAIHPSSSASAMPSVLSADYDAFEGYESTLPPPYNHNMYHTHQTQSHTVASSSPPPAGSAASRSPIPSSRLAVSYASPALVPESLTTRVKLENTSDYGHNLGLSNYPPPRSVHVTYPPAHSGYASNASGYLSDGQASWPKTEYHNVESDQYYPGAGASAFLQDIKGPYRVSRPRKAPRRLTTREEANFQCEVKGCGKLFNRSYNFKAHMETHDEKREYPFPCTADGCNKRFVRKTDLLRHHQSVHMKERNHKCDYCGRMFARKDTLRRHMEDGCSKRFDIGTLDLRAESFDSLNPSGRPLGAPMSHLIPTTTGGLPPMAIPPLGSSGILTSIAPPMRSRDITASANQGRGHSWGR